MPLTKGAQPGSKEFGKNITEMENAGHPQNQSIAAAYAAAKEKSSKKSKEKQNGR